MAFDEIDLNNDLEAAPPPEERSNRAFIIIALGLIFLALIVVACLAGYALYYVPMQRQNQANQVATVDAQNTEVAKSILATTIAEAFTPTPEVTATSAQQAAAAPTDTPVVVIPTNTLVPTGDPRTATVAALFTQAAQAQKTMAPTVTTTALPTTGFADEVGVPGLIGLAALLLVVIIFARRMRTAG
ncbi:MAG: LPXTG cell wall anchor domain-containing protein [Chloroflexota bacterium]|jgi:LPXTG-motif cell wall-anchored protein